MSFAPSDQRCPRCQSPLASGAVTCSTCGLTLSSPGSYTAFSQRPTLYAPQGAPAIAPTIASPLPSSVNYPGPYSGSQPQGNSPYAVAPTSGSISGPAAPPTAPTDKHPGSRHRLALIILVILLLLGGGGGAAAYLLITRPQPTITVTSSYKVGSTLVGATDTVFHITGQQFAKNSTITNVVICRSTMTFARTTKQAPGPV